MNKVSKLLKAAFILNVGYIHVGMYHNKLCEGRQSNLVCINIDSAVMKPQDGINLSIVWGSPVDSDK